MIQFLRYNFISDGNSLDPFPTNVEDVEEISISNGIFNDLLLTQDVTSEYSTEVPDEWDIYTRLLAGFDNSFSGGSVDYNINEITSIRIKRRKLGEFVWNTIYEQPINNIQDIVFSGQDYFAINKEEYEYAWVPVLNNNEGGYVVESIVSNFKGWFIADADTIYKFMMGVQYGPSQQTQQVGIYNPLGQKYPIYIANGANNYQTGSFTGKVVGNYETTHVFNRKEMVLQKNALVEWLTNKRAKVLKDSNGNAWLLFVTGSPSVSYDAQWGNGMMELSFQYGEIGNLEDATDMQNMGLWPVVN